MQERIKQPKKDYKNLIIAIIAIAFLAVWAVLLYQNGHPCK